MTLILQDPNPIEELSSDTFAVKLLGECLINLLWGISARTVQFLLKIALHPSDLIWFCSHIYELCDVPHRDSPHVPAAGRGWGCKVLGGLIVGWGDRYRAADVKLVPLLAFKRLIGWIMWLHGSLFICVFHKGIEHFTTFETRFKAGFLLCFSSLGTLTGGGEGRCSLRTDVHPNSLFQD